MNSSTTMKVLRLCLTLVLLVSLGALTGCNKKIEVDTQNLDYSFQMADDKVKTTVEEAIQAIENTDYSGALAKLKTVEADPKLTPEQKAAVSGVIAQLQR